VKYTVGPPFFELAHEGIPDPRIMAMHVPYPYLPRGCTDCKIIYVTRELKDTCVSYMEFSHKNPYIKRKIALDEAVDMWVEGASLDPKDNQSCGMIYGGMYHAKTYLDAAKVQPIHFINYDELTKDTKGEVTKLAAYLGVKLTEERLAEIIDQSSFKAMKTAAAAEEEAKGRGKGAIGRFILGSPMEWSNILHNKGTQGQGKARMTPEQLKRVDAAYAPYLRGEIGELFVKE